MPSSHGNDENFYKKQIFITLSYTLCRKVKEHFNQLRKSAVLTGKKMSKFEFIEWKKREGGGSKTIDDNTMHEEDDEKKELGDIPNSFHLLTDHHFPLFITYDKFSEMLQGTYGIDARKLTIKPKLGDANDEEDFRVRSPFANMSNALWAHFVNYKLFKEKYWPRFSDYYRKKMDCELVYSEFS